MENNTVAGSSDAADAQISGLISDANATNVVSVPAQEEILNDKWSYLKEFLVS